MKRRVPLVAIVAGLLSGLLSMPSQALASPVAFVFDTSALAGSDNVRFASDLIDGDGIGDTSITLDLFDFGGGGPVGVPSRVGGANGALDGTVRLTDTAFFSSFSQALTHGATLGFRLDVSTTALGLPQPEGFQFSLLDGAGVPFATTDPNGLNALIFREVSSGNVRFEQYALVPEPSTLSLCVIVVAGTILRRRLPCGLHVRGDSRLVPVVHSS